MQRTPAVPPPPQPSWLSWQSDSAVTSRHAEFARPNTISRRATPTGLATYSSRPSMNYGRGCCGAIALNLMAGIRMYDDTFIEAAALLKRALDDADTNPALQVQTRVSLAFAQGMSGQFDESLRNAREAVAHAEAFGYPGLISRALAMFVNTSFLYGHGVDEAGLQRALELEASDADTPIPF